MWNGAVGRSWNAERKTVNEKPHITKKRGVNRRSGKHSDSSVCQYNQGMDLSNFRPSRLWKRMPLEHRIDAADLFWQDEHSADQQIEAVSAIATHMKFRPKSVLTLAPERRAKYLATLPGMTDTIAARALVNYHLARQRPMMGAFLDLLGIAHEEALISDESAVKPEPAKVQEAAQALV